MTANRRLRTALVVAALVVVASTGGVPASAQGGSGEGTGGSAPGPGEFPAPLVVPVLTDESSPPNLAVTSFYVAPATGAADDGAGAGDAVTAELVVRFAEPFRLPEQGRYRVGAHLGDPTGEHRRISFVSVAGVSTGVVETGSGDEWEREGRAQVSFDESEVRIGLPSDIDPAEGMIWLEVSHSLEGETSAQISPLIPLADLLGVGPEPATLVAADLAWGSVAQPPRPPVQVSNPPSVTIADGKIVVTYPGPPPSRVDGREVETILDVLRLAPDFAAAGAAPWLVAIDHQRGEVALLDGTMPVPAAIPNDGSWILEGYPAEGIDAGTELVFDLDGVLSAFGFDHAESSALGIARSLSLEDGTRVRPDGVLGTLGWFEGSEAPPTVTTVPDTAASVGDGSTGAADTGADSAPLALVAVVCVAALVLVCGWVTWRWWRHRVEARYVPPAPPPTTRPEGGQLDELTDQLFGGGSAPDQAVK